MVATTTGYIVGNMQQHHRMRALCHVDAFTTLHTCNLKLYYQVLIAKVLHFITINGASQVLHYERRWSTSTKESKYALTKDIGWVSIYFNNIHTRALHISIETICSTRVMWIPPIFNGTHRYRNWSTVACSCNLSKLFFFFVLEHKVL